MTRTLDGLSRDVDALRRQLAALGLGGDACPACAARSCITFDGPDACPTCGVVPLTFTIDIGATDTAGGPS